MKKLLSLLPAALVLGFIQPAAAEYPEKPIKMIVAYAPGGSTDITARVLAPFIEKYLGGGAKVVVENRPGAGGEIGFTALATAAPDGYTIGFINTPNLISIPIERSVKFNWKQYDLIGNLLDDPGGFSVNSSGKIKNLKDLVEFGKANPGAVTYGTTGVGSDDHLSMLAFERLTGIKATHAPFPGASAVRTALTGNHIMLGSMNIGEAMQYTASGSPFINLGQMSEKRVDIAPDVPTFKEQGYDMVFASLRGVGAPKGLPDDIRKRLVEAVGKTAADPEFQSQMKKTFAPLRYLAPDDYAKELTALEETLKKLWSQDPWAKSSQ
jgi:tripartite-type tricarboxylate transporter receptor subunit TctC